MWKNIAIASLAVALVGIGSFEGIHYWKQQKAESETKKVQEWVVENENDPIHGTSQTRLSKSADGGSKYDPVGPAQFRLYCSAGQKPYVVINTGSHYVYASSRSQYVPFEWRFDNRASQRDEWKVNDDFRTVWPDGEFLSDAVQSKSFWLRVQTAESGYNNLHFDLTGLAELYQQHCGGTGKALTHAQPPAPPEESASVRGGGGGNWDYIYKDGQRRWLLKVEENESSGLVIKCTPDGTYAFLRFENAPQLRTDNTVQVRLVTDGDGTEEDVDFKNGFLYPSPELALKIINAKLASIDYNTPNGQVHHVTMHPEGLKLTDVKAACDWPK